MWPVDSPVQGRGSGFALSHSVPPNTCVFGQIRWWRVCDQCRGRVATPAEQVPEANRVVAPRREPVSGPGLHTGPVDAEADFPSTLPDYTDGEWQKFLRERQAVIDEYV